MAALVYAADRISKILVVENQELGKPVDVLGYILQFRYVENSEAAFSIGQGYTWIIAIIASAAVVFIIIFARRIRSVAWAVLFGMLLGGASGNLTDRLIRPPGFGQGHVVDFIQVYLFPAIFNVADIFVVSAMGLFILLTLLGIGLDGKRTRAPKDDKPDAPKYKASIIPACPQLAGARRACRGAGGCRTRVLLGLRAPFTAEIAEQGGVQVYGRVAGKSDRLSACCLARSRLGGPHRSGDRGGVRARPRHRVRRRRHRWWWTSPAGCAAHPSLGWTARPRSVPSRGAGFRVATSGAAERAGIVHRLDVGTSGPMVVAKFERAYGALKRAFHDREVDKTYHAVVQAHLDPLASPSIDAPIGRHPGSSWKFAVVVDGKDSVTHYETLEAFRSASLLQVELETGRTPSPRTWPPSVTPGLVAAMRCPE